MSKDIVLVSSNKGKIAEVKAVLEPLGFHILSLNDLNITVDIEENGSTYEENALIKARYLKNEYSRIIADDSGIEIFGLDNKPGVYSARFLGENTPYKEKNQIVIDMLKDNEDKGAIFVSVIAYIHNGEEKIFRGEIQGTITSEIRGIDGFGYDPIFLPNGFENTFGEMDNIKKNQISHRANSLNKLKEWLTNEKI